MRVERGSFVGLFCVCVRGGVTFHRVEEHLLRWVLPVVILVELVRGVDARLWVGGCRHGAERTTHVVGNQERSGR